MYFKPTRCFLSACILFIAITAYSQCSLISKSGSNQYPSGVCAPVNFTMDVNYSFLIPVDTSLVEILFVWNDGTGATSTVPGIWMGDSVHASASHLYPPSDECSRTAQAYLVYDGEVCTSSSYQEQTFSTWGTDEENGAVVQTDPQVAYVCEGDDIVNVTFTDNSIFNCNIFIEPDNPNRYYRWVQFIYGTSSLPNDRIPDITVNDGAGNIYTLTDGTGTPLGQHEGPIIQIPIPADGPNQVSYAISAPAGAVTGDVFEITLRNWNVCNPYDNIPSDGIPPADLINGDNPPVTFNARIEIIAPPPVITSFYNDFCAYENIILNVAPNGADINWYTDAAMTNLVHTGNTFDPTLPPVNLDNTVAGLHHFHVTSQQGMCESSPQEVTVEIFDNPTTANAGPDQTVCSDSTFLNGNIPVTGTGQWSVSGAATIENSSLYNTKVTNLAHGSNIFTWTLTNGPCVLSDDVEIISDRQPDPASAGTDDSFCEVTSMNLSADVLTNNGIGEWLILQGTATIDDINDPGSLIMNPSHGYNQFLWRVASEFGACLTTFDTVTYLFDLTPEVANVGPNITVCDLPAITLNANIPTNNGAGTWQVLTGMSTVTDVHNAQSDVTGLNIGVNELEWSIVSEYGLCPGSSDTLTITRDITPDPANAGTDQFFCLQNNTTLTGNSPSIGTGEWIVLENPSGVPPVFSPNQFDPAADFSVLPGNEGRYVLLWQIVNGVCSTNDTVIIEFGIPPPPANAGINDTTCNTSLVLNGNLFPQGTGTWTKISGSGNIIFTPDRFTHNAIASVLPGDEGVYELEWRLTSGLCDPTMDTVIIVFNPAPELPSASDVDLCGPDSVLLIPVVGANGNTIRWYNTQLETVPFHTGLTYQTPEITTGRSYWISSYNEITGCESFKIEIEITIHPIPGTPAAIANPNCGPGAVFINGIPGIYANTNRWYDTRTGGTLISQSANYITPVISSGTWYYLSSYNTSTGCESERDSIEIIIHPPVNEPAVTDQENCGPVSFILHSTLGTNGTENHWYNDSTSMMPVFIAEDYTTPVLASTTSYWVSSYNDSTFCESNKVKVDAMIHPVPGLPDVSDVSRCGPGSVTVNSTPGANGNINRWYDQPAAGILLAETNNYTTPFLSTTTSYWVSTFNTSTMCEGPRQQVEVSVNAYPAPIMISGPSQVLWNQANVIFSVNGNAGSTFTWTIPPEITVENYNDFVRLTFPTMGSYVISVFETTAAGCPGPLTSHPINVTNDSIMVNIGAGNQDACTGYNFMITPMLAGGTPPYTYSWTGDVSNLSSTTNLFPNFYSDVTGTHTMYLEVVDVNLKTAYDTVTITVHESPDVNITNTESVVCVGESLPLNVNISGFPAGSHLWEGEIYTLNANDVQDPVFTPLLNGEYHFTYTYSDINGCHAYDSIHFTTENPVSDFDVITAPGCSPLTVNFQNNSVQYESLLWDFTDGFYSTEFEPEHTFVNESSEPKYFEVALTATSELGCHHTSKRYVTVWPNPQAEIIAIPEEGCSPSIISLFAGPGNSNYDWDFGDGNLNPNGEFNAFHEYINSTEDDITYTVRLITRSPLSCYDTAYKDITIHATPEVNFMVTPEQDTFPNATVTLVNTTSGASWEYDWYLGDGRTYSGYEPGEITYEGPGNYTISLVAKSNYCKDSLPRLVNILPAQPKAVFDPIDPGCMPHTVNFVNRSRFADSYFWEFGNGAVSESPNPTYTYYESGIYKVKLTVKGMGGEDITSDTARVWIIPNSFFDLAPKYVYVNDEPVNFFNLSDNGDKYDWDFGDGSSSDEFNPEHVYKEEGTFDITLKVTTNNNCSDLFVMKNAVIVEPSGIIEYPNVFRPSSSIEDNRTFRPGIIDHVLDYHLMIFNRWGELIYESYEQDVGWDGFVNGKVAKQDVYIWKVTGTYTDGKGFIKSGDVTLLH